MEMTVWMDAWQMQCCGEKFRVGSTVEWTLGPAGQDWLASVLGEAAAEVDAREEHHGGVSKETLGTRGQVQSITAVHCRYAPTPGADSGTRYPVKGTQVLTAVESADRWTQKDHDELLFVGYLVRLATT
ncbi:DUF6578 domain-containing protein [Nonomuraea sp. NPDC049400]|uniref:DUF6578 domain-containing protein n=1 Tax=Nonomuraea sp. NPDC049400 TaxID=3364352 RepID=UPI0037A35C53